MVCSDGNYFVVRFHNWTLTEKLTEIDLIRDGIHGCAPCGITADAIKNSRRLTTANLISSSFRHRRRKLDENRKIWSDIPLLMIASVGNSFSQSSSKIHFSEKLLKCRNRKEVKEQKCFSFKFLYSSTFSLRAYWNAALRIFLVSCAFVVAFRCVLASWCWERLAVRSTRLHGNAASITRVQRSAESVRVAFRFRDGDEALFRSTANLRLGSWAAEARWTTRRWTAGRWAVAGSGTTILTTAVHLFYLNFTENFDFDFDVDRLTVREGMKVSAGKVLKLNAGIETSRFSSGFDKFSELTVAEFN